MLSKKKIISQYEKRILQLEDKVLSFQSAVSELKILNEIAIEAGRTADVNETLRLILNKTTSFLNAEHGAILLVSENNEVLETLIKQAKNSRLSDKPHIGIYITGWILLNKKSLIIKDLIFDDRFTVSKEEKETIKSLICSPIWFEGKIIGVLQMINKLTGQDGQTSFTDDDLTLLSIICTQTGQLLKNSELQQLNFEKKKEAEIAKLETEKLQELDRLKSNFFTNISHEFRTPLTLILGPAEKILSGKSDDIKKDASFIKRNSNRLLQLINQLLDLSKLEAGKLKLEASKGNIVSFVKGAAFSFESISEEKDITLKLFPEKEFIEVYFDKEKMIKVLSNILSNAFKFTPQNGKITIAINIKTPLVPPFSKEGMKGGYIEIKIKDTGIGIPKEEIPKLFNRFYQVDSSFTREYEGTGIGLALTKELIDLHHGTISVESESGKFTEFTISLPLGKEHLKDGEFLVEDKGIEKDVTLKDTKNLAQYREIDSKSSTFLDSSSKVLLNDLLKEDEKTVILIVEDNHDMREYIKDSLGEEYIFEEAVNGEQGIRKAVNIIPDLVISDLMMPKMDGNELARMLKNDEKTCHIPIILLTAKAGHENKIEGLKTGADDYLTKPFDIKELRVRIENLINLRRKLQEKFGKSEYILKYKGEKVGSMDEKFMNKVIEVIEKHLSEEEYSIEELSSEIGMSRSQAHRKIKALTGKSPSIYMRTLRLLKAKNLIEKNIGNISEIAYLVGFSSHAYFTRCFKEEFGYPPSNLTL